MKVNDRMLSLGIVLAACAGGLLGFFSKLPGGTILGSMLAVGLVRMTSTNEVKPAGPKCMTCVQALSGMYIGVKMIISGDLIMELLLPVLAGTMCLIMFSLFFTNVVVKKFKTDKRSAWLSCCPGRMQDMVLISGEFKANVIKIAISHTVRLVFVILVTPLILWLIRWNQ
jgi:membrane AbrB-like protein